MQLIEFLVRIAFELYLMVMILRVWLQVSRADFYNPLSQFVVKASNPIVTPLRSVIPTVGRWDLAALTLAYVISVGKFLALFAMLGYASNVPDLLRFGLLGLAQQFFDLLFWVLIIRAIMSWFVQGYNPMVGLLVQLTEPILAPVRRIIPPLGGLDLSVLIVLIAIQAVRVVLGV